MKITDVKYRDGAFRRVECKIDGKTAILRRQTRFVNSANTEREYVLSLFADSTVVARGNDVPSELVEAYESGKRADDERYQRQVAEHGEPPAHDGPYVVSDPDLLKSSI